MSPADPSAYVLGVGSETFRVSFRVDGSLFVTGNFFGFGGSAASGGVADRRGLQMVGSVGFRQRGSAVVGMNAMVWLGGVKGWLVGCQ